MEVSNTVEANKSSKYSSDMDTLAPIILKAANIDWKALASKQRTLDPILIPKRYKCHFKKPGEHEHLPAPDIDISQGVQQSTHVPLLPRYNLRARRS